MDKKFYDRSLQRSKANEEMIASSSATTSSSSIRRPKRKSNMDDWATKLDEGNDAAVKISNDFHSFLLLYAAKNKMTVFACRAVG